MFHTVINLTTLDIIFFLSSFEKKKLDIIFMPFCKRGENEFFNKLYQHCLPLIKKKKKIDIIFFSFMVKGCERILHQIVLTLDIIIFCLALKKKKDIILLGKGWEQMFEQIVTTLDIMFLSSYEQEKKIDILFLKGVRTN